MRHHNIIYVYLDTMPVNVGKRHVGLLLLLLYRIEYLYLCLLFNYKYYTRLIISFKKEKETTSYIDGPVCALRHILYLLKTVLFIFSGERRDPS